MEKRFDHKKVEEKVYKMWEKVGAFSPEGAQKLRKKMDLPTSDETFCVLMPPPNANAPLHCGHATYAIQDVMTRWHRMMGHKSLHLPGTDHAGFETQVVYERKLKKEGKSRFDFDRETLFNDILNFVNENSDTAINQLKKLGMSADWDRNVFMLDDFVLDTVFETFEKMYKDNLIYRDVYLVNYSPFHGTTFSNLETEHKETVSPLYYVKYQVKDSNKVITVATVRPETIYADVAIAVNPQDSRYVNLVGQMAINPLNDRELPIIADSYVDTEFGTGALKITPGHDFNDYEIGKKHKLPMISVIDLNGRMTSEAPDVEGFPVEEARIRTVEILNEKCAIEKVNENYTNNLLVDYKDQKPIEPMLLPNWFVKMDELSKRAISVIEKNQVRFNLPTWKKEITRWLKEIHDWPISRQIVFGIRIPVWYDVTENPDLHVVFIGKDGETFDGKIGEILKNNDVSLEEIESGLQKVIAPVTAKFKVSRKSPGKNYIQETDTFDTWFSSGQWPLTTLKYPDGKDFKTYYPTNFMDTSWGIIFFWVARMIMFGLYLAEEIPFKMVYFHARIVAEDGQKMSKSRGNVINILEAIEDYGADALRMGVLVGGNTVRRDSPLSMEKIRGYRNFANKIWNMGRFMKIMFENYDKEVPFYTEKLEKKTNDEDKEILVGLEETIKIVNKSFNKLRFKDAGEAIYHFMWNEVADKYIEHVKNREDKEVALSVLRHVFLNCLKLLHPFMPFVTEEVYGQMPGVYEVPLIIANWPE